MITAVVLLDRLATAHTRAPLRDRGQESFSCCCLSRTASAQLVIGAAQSLMPRDFASDASLKTTSDASHNLCGGVEKFLAEAAALAQAVHECLARLKAGLSETAVVAMGTRSVSSKPTLETAEETHQGGSGGFTGRTSRVTHFAAYHQSRVCSRIAGMRSGPAG